MHLITYTSSGLGIFMKGSTSPIAINSRFKLNNIPVMHYILQLVL